MCNLIDCVVARADHLSGIRDRNAERNVRVIFQRQPHRSAPSEAMASADLDQPRRFLANFFAPLATRKVNGRQSDVGGSRPSPSMRSSSDADTQQASGQ